MAFVFSSSRHTYSTDKVVAVVDIVALDVGESPTVMAFEAPCKPVVGMVNECLPLYIRLVFIEFLSFLRLSFSSFMNIGKLASWMTVG